jgi:hypothetical protein
VRRQVRGVVGLLLLTSYGGLAVDEQHAGIRGARAPFACWHRITAPR